MLPKVPRGETGEALAHVRGAAIAIAHFHLRFRIPIAARILYVTGPSVPLRWG